MIDRPYCSYGNDFTLLKGDCRKVLPNLPYRFKMIFADPPYFLSNGGVSVQSGKAVIVDKGEWDVSRGRDADWSFNYEWLKICRDKLTEDGTIWVCGTFHNIYSVAKVMEELGYRILNAITWQKTNPPPNISCRFFKHSTEMIIWARRSRKVPHCYNYELMHKLAGDRQMTDVWRMSAIAPWEKTCGKHPTQKPLSLVVRAILACTDPGELVLDPFSGSGTTGIAANLVGRSFIGIEKEDKFLAMASKRRKLLNDRKDEWWDRISDLTMLT